MPFYGLPRYVPYADSSRAYRGSSGVARPLLAVQGLNELSRIETGFGSEVRVQSKEVILPRFKLRDTVVILGFIYKRGSPYLPIKR